MFSAYVYKLRPSSRQSAEMDLWLNMLRAHYNWCLADRIDTYYQQFIQGEYCNLRTAAPASPLTCCIVKGGATGEPWQKSGKKRNAATIQDAELVGLKATRPWYKRIHSNVLQRNIARLNAAYKNFFEHGFGFPSFKNRSNFRSFEYKPGDVKIRGNRVYLPSIGWMRFFTSRTIPQGFEIRTVTIRKKTGGWFISVRIEDKSVPENPTRTIEEISTAIGLDMGITKLAHVSDGSDIPNPRFATNKKTKRLMKVRQRRASRAKKSSKNRAKRFKEVASLHNKIASCRNTYQWQVAGKLVKKADAIIVEDLNIRGMMSKCKTKKDDQGRFLANGQSAKRSLNRAIADASWGELISKIDYCAAKCGKVLLKVCPRQTSQTCVVCGVVDAASRDKEKFICTSCGHIDHADKQASRNIKNKGVELYSLTLKKVRGGSAKPLKKLIQLALWGTPSAELTASKRKQPHARKSRRVVPGNLDLVQLDLFQDIWGVNSIESPHF